MRLTEMGRSSLRRTPHRTSIETPPAAQLHRMTSRLKSRADNSGLRLSVPNPLTHGARKERSLGERTGKGPLDYVALRIKTWPNLQLRDRNAAELYQRMAEYDGLTFEGGGTAGPRG